MAVTAVPEALVRSAAHVFVEDLDDPRLTGEDASHLERSLRLRDGESVTASDGRGRWRACRFAGAGAELLPDGDVVDDPCPQPAVTVAFSLTKGASMDWVVHKLTEVGVDTIVPLRSARSVPRWTPDRALGHIQRFRRIAREASMQARRTTLARVADVAGFEEVVGDPALATTAAIAHPGDGGPLSLGRPAVLIGPEGGWEAAEASCGLPRVGLGPTVLRADTAAVVAGAYLCAIRSSLLAEKWGTSP